MSLTVSPPSTSVTPFGTRQFTATVEGTNDTGVTWSVDGVAGGNNTVGTISTGGLYTAPANLGSHTVTATSSALPTYSVNASVSVVNAPPGTVSVLTYHNDDVRDGVNVSETVLNTSNVNSAAVRQIVRAARWTRRFMLSRYTAQREHRRSPAQCGIRRHRKRHGVCLRWRRAFRFGAVAAAPGNPGSGE